MGAGSSWCSASRARSGKTKRSTPGPTRSCSSTSFSQTTLEQDPMKHYNQALTVAQAITKGLKDEITNIGPAPEDDGLDARHSQRWACRGAASRMLQNLWFDVF